MYFHVPPEPTMQKLGKFFSSPLSSIPYTDIKTELPKLTTLSDKQCYAAFSRDVELGDSKPFVPPRSPNCRPSSLKFENSAAKFVTSNLGATIVPEASATATQS